MRTRLIYLDIARAFSIIFIIIYHFNVRITMHGVSAPPIFMESFPNGNLGSIGVSLFIILSGAALMTRYGESLDLKEYFIKRFTSMYPLYWVAYMLAFLTLFWLNGKIPTLITDPLWKIVYTIIGMDGFLFYKTPTFYLLGEWYFGFIIILYMLFPLLRKFLIKYPVCTIGAVLLGHFILLSKYHVLFQIDPSRNPLVRIPELMFGMILVRFLNTNNVWYFIITSIISFIFYTKSVPLPGAYWAYNNALVGIAIFYIFAYVSTNISLSEKFQKCVLFLSNYSFGAFLLHHVIIIQIMNSNTGRILSTFESYILFLVALILSFGLAIPLAYLGKKVSNLLLSRINGTKSKDISINAA